MRALPSPRGAPEHLVPGPNPDPKPSLALQVSFQLAIELGILFAYIINYLAVASPYGWVVSLAAALPTSLAFVLIGAVALPESPRYLLIRGRQAEAEAVLATSLRTPAHNVKEEVATILEELAEPGLRSEWRDLCRLPAVQRRRAFIAVIVLMLQVAPLPGLAWPYFALPYPTLPCPRVHVPMLQVGTGIDFVTVFAPRIFSQIANASALPTDDALQMADPDPAALQTSVEALLHATQVADDTADLT